MEKLNEDKKSKIGVMGVSLMNSILYMFINTFMVAYFITLTNYDYKLISMYYVLSFIFIGLTFLVLGRIVKNKTQVKLLKVGIVIYCIYVLVIALLKESIVNYYIYLGIFYGIVQGVLWSALHSLINEYNRSESNDFVSLKSILSKLIKIVSPIVFGISIEITTFSYIAKIVLIVSLIQFIFSLLISDKKHINNKEYNLGEYRNYINTNKKIKIFYKVIACEGIIKYFLETLITILIVMTFKTTISLGILTTIFSICSIISVYVFQRRLKNNKHVLRISTIMMIISMLILLFEINRTTIIIYNLCNSIFLVLLINNSEEKRYSVVNNDKRIVEDYIIEHQVTSEVYLNVSRILAFLVLVISGLFNNMIVFKILLFLVTIVVIYCTKLMIFLEENKTI